MVDEGKRCFGSNLFNPCLLYPNDETYEDYMMTADSIRLAHTLKPDDDECAATAFQLRVSVFTTTSIENKGL